MENRFYNAFDRESLTGESLRETDYRTVFQANRDRIIHTSAFRRLQSKTQVFFSGEYDFYRTRLTHSIEVSQIGRSICASLQARCPQLADDYFIDPDLVEAACLAHDLGHPPFGHSGERTLNDLMRPYGGFEGNAQTLRLLTETIFSGRREGMNPSRAFLDSTLKYKTLYTELDEPDNHFLYDFQEQYLDFVNGGQPFPSEALPPGKARDGFRSIECHVMDWADDTAYSLNDLADSINAGFINIEKLERWAEYKSLAGEEARHVDELITSIRESRVEGRLGWKIGAFIAGCELVEESNFLSGATNRYRYSLSVDPRVREEAELYKAIALDLVFLSQEMHQLEFKSGQLLSNLFEVLEDRYVKGKGRLHLLPEAEEAAIAAADTPQMRARVVCDVVAAMTDGFATRTYKRLFDADFGSIGDLV